MASDGNSGLLKWLERNNAQLAGRIRAIRTKLGEWLPLVVSTFPHYPSHSVDHSDRIAHQLSKLLGFAGTSKKPPKGLPSFSAAEAYCLLCAIYLHDIGMVVPESEKQEILESEAWKSFTSAGGAGHEDHRNYTELHEAGTNLVERFQADWALRYLLAEFVRREHHRRMPAVLKLNPFLKELVDDGDAVAFNSVAAICVGHGLTSGELQNKVQFPEIRDVFGEYVNVRFLARLLRIGDLLDLSINRATPITLRAVGMLPESSYAHWAQYDCKSHELVNPDRIEYSFECKDQDTHRVIREWMGWLEAEVAAARLDQMHAARHREWRAPQCAIALAEGGNKAADGREATIVISPAADAAYRFHDWRLELDQERVIERLIYDIYEEPQVFLRELLQNALDATRCQMYADFAKQNHDVPPPESPTQFPVAFRERYPVRIRIDWATVDDSGSGDGPDSACTVTVEDRGIGMTTEVIKRYFLQIARSFYKSEEFRTKYSFAPTSRFGVGFLSVFAVSDDITVETRSVDEPEGIRLRLRGPTSYLLTESWPGFDAPADVPSHGTRICVRLREPQLFEKRKDGGNHNERSNPKTLSEWLVAWCARVEVPVEIDDGGDLLSLTMRRRWSDGEHLAASQVEPEGRFVRRVIDLDVDGIEGQVCVHAYEDQNGEAWCDRWSRKSGINGERLERHPEVGLPKESLHGITISGGWFRGDGAERLWSYWIDRRGNGDLVPMSRSRARGHVSGSHSAQDGAGRRLSGTDQLVEDAVCRAITEHLGGSQRAAESLGFRYVRDVVEASPLNRQRKVEFPGALAQWDGSEWSRCSGQDLVDSHRISVVMWKERFKYTDHGGRVWLPVETHLEDVPVSSPVVSLADLSKSMDTRLTEWLGEANVTGMHHCCDLVRVTFEKPAGERVPASSRRRPALFASSPEMTDAAYVIEWRPANIVLLNRNHPLVSWMFDILWKSDDLAHEEKRRFLQRCIDQFYDMKRILHQWANSSEVPESCRPPASVAPWTYTNLVGRPSGSRGASAIDGTN